jgi:SAM-dependent methyltransferase
MKNPWVDIPEADYVGHMSSPEVGQHEVLNRMLGDALRSVRARCVLVLGCSSGNGVEHVDPAVTSRVVGVDVNAAYLQQFAARYQNPAFTLDLRCADLDACRFDAGTFDLVHAALVFEYVAWRELLPRIVEALCPQGVVNIVLQLPSSMSPAVTPTTFSILRSLETIFRFVDPALLVADATKLGLRLDLRRTVQLESGKAFEVLRFCRVLDSRDKPRQ